MGDRTLAKVTLSEQGWATAPPTVIRCSSNYVTTGERCRSQASAGTLVCDKHGARLPDVQKAAATRIGMSADDAARKLIAWMADPAVDMRERIKIAHDLLDRGGLGATAKHVVGVAQLDPVETLFRDLLNSPGMLVDPTALPPAKVVTLDLQQEALDEYEEGGELRARTIHGEVVHDAHTVHMGEAAKTPKHIREALARLL